MDVTAAGNTNIETARLRLESISPRLVAAIVAGRRTSQDRWHPEYPLVDELDPLQSLAANPAPDPVFTMYMIRQSRDGLAIGGLGFFGPPDDSGRVEIGYGLVSTARGAGLATEAVLAALRVAAEHGATMVAADTENDNRASQHVLLKAGFVETRRDQQATFFARPLGSPFSPARPVVYEIDGSAINDLDDLYRLLGEAVHGQGFRRQPGRTQRLLGRRIWHTPGPQLHVPTPPQQPRHQRSWFRRDHPATRAATRAIPSRQPAADQSRA